MNRSLMVKAASRPVPWVDEVDHESLFDLLDRIFALIAEHSSGAPPRDQADPPSSRWEDDDYIYLESDHPGTQEREADISIHQNRVFIRIAKP